MKKNIIRYSVIVIATLAFQSCQFYDKDAEGEIKRLQERLDTINAYTGDIDLILQKDTIRQNDLDSISRILMDIEYECGYDEYDFYVPITE